MPHHTLPDAELIRCAQRGDAIAVETIYERYAPQIHRYISAQVEDDQLAEDILADVFVRMLEGLGRYEDRGYPISSWLYRIARDRTVDALRRRRATRNVPLESITLTHAGFEDLVALRIEREQLTIALGWLTEEQRQVILLRFFDGMSLQEVAASMGRSEGSIKSLQHRGLASLARQYPVGRA